MPSGIPDPKMFQKLQRPFAVMCSRYWECTWFAVGRSASYEVPSLTTSIVQYLGFMRPSFNCEKWPGCVVFVHNPTIKLSSGGDFLFSFTFTSPSSSSPYCSISLLLYSYSFILFRRVLMFFALHNSNHLRQLPTQSAYCETH